MKNLLKSFVFAFKGVQYAVSTQLNFRVHLIATLTAVFLGVYLHISTYEWLVIILWIGLVLFAELINTALEHFTDLVSPNYNKTAGQVKDVAAAAVLVVALLALLSGCIIFIPKIRLLFNI